MHIYSNPNRARVFELLSQCDLPSSDLKNTNLDTFLGCGDEANPSGIIGLEQHGNFGLLRSLAVAPEARNRGYAKQLVAKAEETAKYRGIKSIYLLTDTAEQFFTKLGYNKVERISVPNAIKSTAEFSSLCPESAAVMVKVIDR
ncbi:MAG: arsenic resistance N-acetyltransferase ArsN2 [Candidatus Thiodiazotropha sp.]